MGEILSNLIGNYTIKVNSFYYYVFKVIHFVEMNWVSGFAVCQFCRFGSYCYDIDILCGTVSCNGSSNLIPVLVLCDYYLILLFHLLLDYSLEILPNTPISLHFNGIF